MQLSIEKGLSKEKTKEIAKRALSTQMELNTSDIIIAPHGRLVNIVTNWTDIFQQFQFSRSEKSKCLLQSIWLYITLPPVDDLSGASTLSLLLCDGIWDLKSLFDVIWGSLSSCGVIWGSLSSCSVIWGSLSSCDIIWGSLSSCDVIRGSLSSCDVIWGSLSSCDVIRGSLSSCDVIWGSLSSSSVLDSSLEYWLGSNSCIIYNI